MATSYIDLCVPPFRESPTYYDRRCNIWGKNCRKKFIQSWFNSDYNKFNKCLLRSEYGRPSLNASGDLCYTKKGKKGKGTEVCAKFDLGSNTVGQPHQVVTNPSSIPGSVGQLGLAQDKGTAMDKMATLDTRILIGAAVALLLIMR